MPIALYRIDDRLIHGQVVVGWGQPFDLRFIVLVDDVVAASEWEQELYRMAVPPEMEVCFLSVENAAAQLPAFNARRDKGVLLVGSVAVMDELVSRAAGQIAAVNVGGVHHAAGRTGHLRYVFLTDDEEQGLRRIADRGVEVTAQDVPATRPVPLAELLASSMDA